MTKLHSIYYSTQQYACTVYLLEIMIPITKVRVMAFVYLIKYPHHLQLLPHVFFIDVEICFIHIYTVDLVDTVLHKLIYIPITFS